MGSFVGIGSEVQKFVLNGYYLLNLIPFIVWVTGSSERYQVENEPLIQGIFCINQGLLTQQYCC